MGALQGWKWTTFSPHMLNRSLFSRWGSSCTTTFYPQQTLALFSLLITYSGCSSPCQKQFIMISHIMVLSSWCSLNSEITLKIPLTQFFVCMGKPGERFKIFHFQSWVGSIGRIWIVITFCKKMFFFFLIYLLIMLLQLSHFPPTPLHPAHPPPSHIPPL